MIQNCGNAVGPDNNLVPCVNVFSEGEVFRNGVSSRFRNKSVIFTGCFLVSLGRYKGFAPIYWIMLLANLKRLADVATSAEDQVIPS